MSFKLSATHNRFCILSFQFTYGSQGTSRNSASVQLTFVRLLSKEASQRITFHCRNSVAYRDDKAGNLKKAAILKAADGTDLRAYGNSRTKYTVTEDGCSVSCLGYLFLFTLNLFLK